MDDFVALPDRKRVPLAIVASILVHLFLIAVFLLGPLMLPFFPAGCDHRIVAVVEPTPTPPPLEIVLMPSPPEGPPPPPPPLTPVEGQELEQKFAQMPEEFQREYLDVEGLAQRKNLSKRALLESWADSVAGTTRQGRGNSALPAQDGREDLPFTNFKNQQATVGDPKKMLAPEARIPTLDDPAPLYKPAPVAKPDLARSEPENIPQTATLETPTPTPVPVKPGETSVAKAATPPPNLRTVSEAAQDEIPMFVLAQPRPSGLPMREEPLPQIIEQVPKPTPVPTPQPTPVPKPTPTPFNRPTPAPLPTPKPAINQIEANRLASLNRPTPVPNPGYSPHMERRKIEGGNAPLGASGVDAVATNRGRYMKSLNQAVGSRWTYYVRDVRQASLITAGSVTMKFAINAKGKIMRLQVTDNTSNSAHAALCERAFLESQSDIDPPPRELLRGGAFEDTFTFTLY